MVELFGPLQRMPLCLHRKHWGSCRSHWDVVSRLRLDYHMAFVTSLLSSPLALVAATAGACHIPSYHLSRVVDMLNPSGSCGPASKALCDKSGFDKTRFRNH
jgi:hypothetical protein